MNLKNLLLLLAAVALFTAPQAGAAEVLVAGSFSISGFTDNSGTPLTLTPDPFNLSFSTVVTIDDATLASNALFGIQTVLDMIGPDPLVIGGESFSAGDINLQIGRNPGEEGEPSHTLSVSLGIGIVDALSSSDNDFAVYFYDLIAPSGPITLPHTLQLEEFDLVHRLANTGGTSVGYATAYSGSVTLSLVPEPSSLVLLGLGGLLIARRRH